MHKIIVCYSGAMPELGDLMLQAEGLMGDMERQQNKLKQIREYVSSISSLYSQFDNHYSNQELFFCFL